jgi:hypothetical protein
MTAPPLPPPPPPPPGSPSWDLQPPPPPPPPGNGPAKKPLWRRIWVLITAGIVLLLIIIGAAAGGGSKNNSKPAAQPTNPPSISLPPAQAAPPAEVAPPTEQPPTTEPTSPEAQPVTTFAMPNEVGANLQTAQDDIQRVSGNPLFITSSEDATGAGRHQILDRNWKVCSQNVPTGTSVDQSADIIFGAVKLTESCP